MDLLECVKLSIETMDLDNESDIETTLLLINCYEKEQNAILKKNKKKKLWKKMWRYGRDQKGSISFLTKELNADKGSFLNYIRMSEEILFAILAKIENNIKNSDTIMRAAIPPKEKLAVTLRFLATGESYKSLNYQTRLSTSFLSKCIPEVCDAIWKQMKTDYLKFPNTIAEWEKIADDFAVKWQFPNCLGAIDGKHIAFGAKRSDGAFYYNYKGFNSIVLLALVDANCKFIYIDAGCNGRANDAGVFLQSDLKAIFDNSDTNFPKEKVVGNGRKLPYVVVGDDAFALQKQCKIFNKRISRARQVVERPFGILCNRFRILLNNFNLKVENVELITRVCCLLHNYLITNSREYVSFAHDLQFPNEPEQKVTTRNSSKSSAENIRQSFMEYFNEEGFIN